MAWQGSALSKVIFDWHYKPEPTDRNWGEEIRTFDLQRDRVIVLSLFKIVSSPFPCPAKWSQFDTWQAIAEETTSIVHLELYNIWYYRKWLAPASPVGVHISPYLLWVGISSWNQTWKAKDLLYMSLHKKHIGHVLCRPNPRRHSYSLN